MNFINTYKQGQSGYNVGRTTGIPELDIATRGTKRKMSIGLAAATKCGKTTFVDYGYVLSPYLAAEKKGDLENLDWMYNSYEIDRVSKEFKFAAFFMAHDYGVYDFTYRGQTYTMCSDYLMGGMSWKDNPKNIEEEPKLIPVSKEHHDMIREIYQRRIVPLFGEWGEKNTLITPGKITFYDEATNPTGANKQLIEYAAKRGTFTSKTYTVTHSNNRKETITKHEKYTPNNPNLLSLIITDHIRKFLPEQGFNKKETIDKWLEYTTAARNMLEFSFVNICHSNRGVSNVERLRASGEFIYPTSDDVKDTGNLAEESTMLITLFFPGDEKYNLKKHFGVELDDNPNYRSIHITESRNTEAPVHIRARMLGGVNMWLPFNEY